MSGQIKSLFWASALTACIATSAAAQCDLPVQKKQKIVEFLCGNAGTEYPRAGPDCVKLSSEARILDTAKQIYALKMCGFDDEAERLTLSSLETMELMQPLVSCTNTHVVFRDIFEEQMRATEGVAKGAVCSPVVRAKIISALPKILDGIKLAEAGSLSASLGNAFQIRIMGDGSVRDR